VAREKTMLTCSILTCLMALVQAKNEQVDILAQLHPHADSQDVTWVQELDRPAPLKIRGPYWSRGFALHQTVTRQVWLTPGAPGAVLGRAYGVSLEVDF